MKITKSQLKQIIKEELSKSDSLNEMASSELEKVQQMLADAEKALEAIKASDSRFKDLELTVARKKVEDLKMMMDQIKRRS